MSNRALRIYLNDHLAGATLGSALAARAARENEGRELGLFLERLHREISEDLMTLKQVMRCVRAPANPAKRLAALALERVGRAKLNDSVRSYSDLSRLVELEALATGVMGKHALWQALEVVHDKRLNPFDFLALASRAVRQREEIEEHRQNIATRALNE